MTNVKKIDQPFVKEFRRSMTPAFEQVMKDEFGLNVEIGKISFNSKAMTFEMKVMVPEATAKAPKAIVAKVKTSGKAIKTKAEEEKVAKPKKGSKLQPFSDKAFKLFCEKPEKNPAPACKYCGAAPVNQFNLGACHKSGCILASMREHL